MKLQIGLLFMSLHLAIAAVQAQSLPGDKMLADYFRAETKRLSDASLAEIKTIEDWNVRKPKYREELFYMLGLSPLPPKTDLKPVITGKIEHNEFTVEKLHFQSKPGLYVTANFYLPKKATTPLPVILYVCGHAKVVTNGVSYGNKTAYQHHGAWFARNGYACLIVDTLQLGEIEGIHHGTYREKMWWWNSRGYTPAGVEAWNNIRALDYLATRPEVDMTKVGMTGRSGGGAYTWTLAALDDRVKVAAPIAGITDLENHVVDGCVEGHCDCMFQVNSYRWDFPLLASLCAPRPLMIGNSDKDKIFPLNGIERLHAKVKGIYDLHNASNNLALLITDGPHEDTQDLQVPVFRWFNRKLKGVDPVIEMAAVKFFQPHELKVFDKLPEDQINTTIHQRFVPLAPTPEPPESKEQWALLRDNWMNGLRDYVFAGWPWEKSVAPREVFTVEKGGISFSAYDYQSQENLPLRLYVLRSGKRVAKAEVNVLDASSWPAWVHALSSTFNEEMQQEKAVTATTKTRAKDFDSWRQELQRVGCIVYVAPRGVGLSAWSGDERRLTHIRRRFMLLGQTVDSMRVWDIRRALQAVRSVAPKTAVTLNAQDDGAVNALYASLFEPVATLNLRRLPKSHRDGPDYLNVMRILDIPQTVALAVGRSNVVLDASDEDQWQFARQVERLTGTGSFKMKR